MSQDVAPGLAANQGRLVREAARKTLIICFVRDYFVGRGLAAPATVGARVAPGRVDSHDARGGLVPSLRGAGAGAPNWPIDAARPPRSAPPAVSAE
jgi:hypothetical protein